MLDNVEGLPIVFVTSFNNKGDECLNHRKRQTRPLKIIYHYIFTNRVLPNLDFDFLRQETVSYLSPEKSMINSGRNFLFVAKQQKLSLGNRNLILNRFFTDSIKINEILMGIKICWFIYNIYKNRLHISLKSNLLL